MQQWPAQDARDLWVQLTLKLHQTKWSIICEKAWPQFMHVSQVRLTSDTSESLFLMK